LGIGGSAFAGSSLVPQRTHPSGRQRAGAEPLRLRENENVDMGVSSASTIVLLAVLAAAVFMDIGRGKIYNVLTVPAMAAGLAIAAAGGLKSLQVSVLGLAAGLALGGMLMAVAHLGGGDAKLLMAIGALKGLNFLIWSFLLGAVAGGVVAAAILARKRLLTRALPAAAGAAIQAALVRSAAPRFAFTGVRMAYAPALAVGCLAALVL